MIYPLRNQEMKSSMKRLKNQLRHSERILWGDRPLSQNGGKLPSHQKQSMASMDHGVLKEVDPMAYAGGQGGYTTLMWDPFKSSTTHSQLVIPKILTENILCTQLYLSSDSCKKIKFSHFPKGISQNFFNGESDREISQSFQRHLIVSRRPRGKNREE
jgi:hypothetical protein